MMELPVPIFVVACILVLAALVSIGISFGHLAEKVFGPAIRAAQERNRIARYEGRLSDHDRSCYTTYYSLMQEQTRRIQHLERALRMVPVELRSRRVAKLVGKRRP